MTIPSDDQGVVIGRLTDTDLADLLADIGRDWCIEVEPLLVLRQGFIQLVGSPRHRAAWHWVQSPNHTIRLDRGFGITDPDVTPGPTDLLRYLAELFDSGRQAAVGEGGCLRSRWRQPSASGIVDLLLLHDNGLHAISDS